MIAENVAPIRTYQLRWRLKFVVELSASASFHTRSVNTEQTRSFPLNVRTKFGSKTFTHYQKSPFWDFYFNILLHNLSLHVYGKLLHVTLSLCDCEADCVRETLLYADITQLQSL